MTTFEITIIVLLTAIVVLLIVLLRTAIEGFHGVWQNQSYNYTELRKIVVCIGEEIGQTNARIDGFIPWARLLRQRADNLENNTAITASIVGKIYNNLCGISDKEKPCKADIKQKITQMSSNNTAAMLENMADIRKEQEQQTKGGKQ